MKVYNDLSKQEEEALRNMVMMHMKEHLAHLQQKKEVNSMGGPLLLPDEPFHTKYGYLAYYGPFPDEDLIIENHSNEFIAEITSSKRIVISTEEL